MPPCNCEQILFENMFTGEHFITKIISKKSDLLHRSLKRRIDFPLILPKDIKLRLKAQGKRITQHHLEKYGFRCVRIAFCLRRNDPNITHHFHLRILLKKLHPSTNPNVEKRTSLNMGTIDLLSTLRKCPDKIMCDY